MILLMFVNWGLESYKWKIALRPIQPVSFIHAYKAILAGTCIASFTPNRVGEYMGRMLLLKEGNKLPSVAPTILCSMSQMLVTLIAGVAGLIFHSGLSVTHKTVFLGFTSAIYKPAVFLTAGSAVLLGLVYFRFDPMVQKLNRWLKKNERKITIPQDYRFSSLALIFLLSVIRYAVFILQYALLFSLFGIPLIGKQVFTGVSVMFVLMAIVPTLTFLTDLGFRWAVGIQVFQVFTTNTAGILAVSLGIWLINLIIPALIGSLLILRIKLFSSR